MRTKIILAAIFQFVFLSQIVVVAQQATSRDSLLTCMTGKWVLRGTIDGVRTTHDVDVQWVLGHQYVQLNEVSRETDKNGNPLYEATVFICWERALNQYSCLWLDNTGNSGLSAQAVGHAGANGDRIDLLFKINDESSFYTTFIFDRAVNKWHWLMDGEQNGNRIPFARVELTRD